MKLTPQTYIETTVELAKDRHHCDTVQHKYNGRWVRVEVSRSLVRIYTAEREPIDDLSETFYNAPENVCGTFIGNLVLDHSSITLWDMWEVCGSVSDDLRTSYTSLEHYSYRDRYSLLKGQMVLWKTVPNPYTLVKSFPIQASKELWQEDVPHTCGLVYRNSRAPVPGPLHIGRRYREVPKELV